MAAAVYKKWIEGDGLMLVTAWSRDGVEYNEIARRIGVAAATLREWRGKYPALATALARTREIVDYEVENALHKRALGYDAVQIKAFKIKRVDYDPETGKKCGEREEVVQAEERVHIPADVNAQKFWLINRKRADWSERPDPAPDDTEGRETGVVVLAPVTDDAAAESDAGGDAPEDSGANNVVKLGKTNVG